MLGTHLESGILFLDVNILDFCYGTFTCDAKGPRARVDI